MSFVTAVLLAFYIGYIPLHVFLEDHGHVEASSGVAVDDHHDDAHHEDDHVPHAAADHELHFVLKAKAPVFVMAVMVSQLPLQLEPEDVPATVFPEVFQIPEEPAPDPLQPRAPPVS
jgi:hypothetical protein